MIEFSRTSEPYVQYIPRNMHTVTALLCFVVVIHWLIFPYPSGSLHWHCGNLTTAPVPAKQPWWIWINTSCEFIMNDCITTTKQSTTNPCAYFLAYTVRQYCFETSCNGIWTKIRQVSFCNIKLRIPSKNIFSPSLYWCNLQFIFHWICHISQIKVLSQFGVALSARVKEWFSW